MENSQLPVLQVAGKAVIINSAGKVLIVREALSGKNNTQIGKWGLTGGRLHPGESFFDGLKREVKEETGLEIEPIKPLHVGEWRPEIRGVPHHIIAIFMLCTANSTDVVLSHEHDDSAWIDPSELERYQMMEPDGLVVKLVPTSQ